MASNTLITTSLVGKETLRLLVGKLQAAKMLRSGYDSNFGKSGFKVGSTINVRLPNRFTVGNGSAVTAQNYTETVTPVVVDTQSNVAIEVVTSDLTLSLDSFSDRFVKPAVATLAGTIESKIMQKLAQSAFLQVGTPGTAITSTDIFFDAVAKLQDFLIPYDEINMLISPKTYAKAGKLMTNLFLPSTNEKVQTGSLGHAFGADWFTSAYTYTQTVGAATGTLTISGASQSGTSIAIGGFAVSTNGVLNVGDIITVNNVYFVHPITKAITTNQSQHVVTATANSNASGVATVQLYPGFYDSSFGAQQTVNALPANSASVTVAGTAGSSYGINMALYEDAGTFVSVPLDVVGAAPGNVWTETDPESGLSVTVEQWRDARAGSTIWRVDCLWGVSPLRREAMCRVVSGV